MEKRRTNRAFLSDEEAARESRRTEDFVRSIAGTNSTNVRIDKKKQIPKEHKSTCYAENSVMTVGESKGFAVDFDKLNKIISIYGKEVSNGCQLKLKVRISETKDLICLLEKAKTVAATQEVTRIGEGIGYIIDYDGIHRLVMIYNKEVSKFQYKLVFTQSETTSIIDLLMKARSML